MSDPVGSQGMKLVRAPVVRIYDFEDTTVIMTNNTEQLKLTGDTSQLARAVLTFVSIPRSSAEILERIEELSGEPLERPQVIEELLSLLQERGALCEVSAPGPRKTAPGPRRRLVLGLTGAASTMHAPGLVQQLQSRGFEVRIVATENALRFVNEDALFALTHQRVLTGLWSTHESLPVPHINLAEWADAMLICPASATTLSRLATGDYSSLVAATALTCEQVIVVPSMNARMYLGAAVQRNLQQLIDDGMYVLHPASGIELADAPFARTPMLGPAPPHKVVIELLETILKKPRSWDAIYRSKAPSELPWSSEHPDTDMVEAMKSFAKDPADVLDVGAGLGTLARCAASLGHRVTATDVAREALVQARSIDEAPVLWLHDDITNTRLMGTFDIVLDRGCLHVLDEAQAQSYASSIADLVRPKGILIIKVHTSETHGTTPYDALRLSALLSGFSILSEKASTLPYGDHDVEARLFVLQRK